MYGKIDKNGNFQVAHRIVEREGDVIILRPMTSEELAEGNYKEVYRADGSGSPGPGKVPSNTYEDKGEFILERTNWVDAGDVDAPGDAAAADSTEAPSETPSETPAE